MFVNNAARRNYIHANAVLLCLESTRLAALGPDAELLALIIRSGSRDMSAITLSQALLNGNGIYKGLTGLNYMSQEELMRFKGVGKVKAVQILAITEISKRMSAESFKPKEYHNSPESIALYFME